MICCMAIMSRTTTPCSASTTLFPSSGGAFLGILLYRSSHSAIGHFILIQAHKTLFIFENTFTDPSSALFDTLPPSFS